MVNEDRQLGSTKRFLLVMIHCCRYVISNILLAAIRPLCSAPLLRLTNMVYPFMTLYAVTNLLKELHPQQTRRQHFRSAAVVISFPLLWFFNFVYYTDGGSAALVLLSWLAAKKRHHLLSAVVRIYLQWIRVGGACFGAILQRLISNL